MSVNNLVALADSSVASQEIVTKHLQTSTAILQDIFSDYCQADGHLCQHCGKIYKTPSTLHSHTLLKHQQLDGNDETQCMTCEKTYSSVLSLKKHENYKHRFEHHCTVCYRSYKTKDLLAHHEQSCTREEAACPSCGKMYCSPIALRNHIKYKHPEETKHWCERCRRSFSSARRLLNHTASVHAIGGTACVSCNKLFQTVAALQSHILYRHSEGSVRCPHCHKVFATQSRLTKHLMKNHIQRSEKYQCGACMLGFQSFKSLVEHTKDIHGE